MRNGALNPVRLAYAKRGKIRWISHRDVARAFERAMRVERLPIAFSEGFSPHPKVSFGLALATGYESDAEYLDVSLTDAVDLGVLPSRLSAALPTGLTVTGAVALRDGAPALQESVTSTEWIVTLADIDTAALAVAVDALVGADVVQVTRSKKGRTVTEDVRAAIRRVAPLDGSWSNAQLDVELAAHPQHAKPAELLAALAVVGDGAFGELRAAQVLRTHQWIERDGARLSPLDADALARLHGAPEIERDTDVRHDRGSGDDVVDPELDSRTVGGARA